MHLEMDLYSLFFLQGTANSYLVEVSANYLNGQLNIIEQMFQNS